ncbi:hypothetical protein A3L11_02490 [Thermococcus siculi]|uniref:DUF835 domain-containing protein n=1 Tax=Thermococcus siculi TaxID=72803 RepID=A0A2Z2MNB4_9EURY|nr:DUF835 domain-containing protein [Thermococcus siculi]ASJ08154.1 hypothetical protein A3L11_02490 [Thermococcus siculi]
MGLMVHPLVLAGDLVLLVVIGYAALYALQRVHRYSEPLNRFIVVVTISLILATFGRLLDLLDDLMYLPRIGYLLEYILYFFSIVGVTYGVLSYISSIERRILPAPPRETGSGSLSPGGYLHIGEEGIVEFLSSVDVPTLVMTRSPWKYKELKNVQTLWVTPVGEEGVGPTRLHVLLEAAVDFMKGSGRLVVVDCLEVLVLYNDFAAVFRFLSAMKDYAISSGSAVLLLVEEGTLEDKEFNLLIREFKPVKALASILRTSS